MSSLLPRLPPQTCDCHMHVFDQRFPVLPGALLRDAPAAAYRTLAAELGIERMVIVQPSGYGFDNACTLDALAQLGPAARAIVVIPPETTPAELRHLHAAGVRGVRYMMLRPGGLQWDSMPRMAAALAPLGWHLNLQFDGHALPQRAAALRALPVDLVIDHVGAFHDGVSPDDEAFRTLLSLLETGRVWVKLSGPYTYRMSRSGPPDYPEVARLVRILAAQFPERCLWATDWPHVSEPEMLPDAPLIAAFRDWVADAPTRHRILVENAALLYGFDQ